MNDILDIHIDTLHELAFLYLELVHRTDERLDPLDVHMVEWMLSYRHPHKNPAAISHIVREATLTHLDPPDPLRFMKTVADLGSILPSRVRSEIHCDLITLAYLDGSVRDEALNNLAWIAEAWSLC